MKMFIISCTSLFVISDHSLNKNHQFNWDKKKVITRKKEWEARKTKQTEIDRTANRLASAFA